MNIALLAKEQLGSIVEQGYFLVFKNGSRMFFVKQGGTFVYYIFDKKSSKWKSHHILHCQNTLLETYIEQDLLVATPKYSEIIDWLTSSPKELKRKKFYLL